MCTGIAKKVEMGVHLLLICDPTLEIPEDQMTDIWRFAYQFSHFVEKNHRNLIPAKYRTSASTTLVSTDSGHSTTIIPLQVAAPTTSKNELVTVNDVEALALTFSQKSTCSDESSDDSQSRYLNSVCEELFDDKYGLDVQCVTDFMQKNRKKLDKNRPSAENVYKMILDQNMQEKMAERKRKAKEVMAALKKQKK